MTLLAAGNEGIEVVKGIFVISYTFIFVI